MADFITTKYGTRINVRGLDPAAVERVRSMAEDKGAYGQKGAALAAQLQKRAGTGGGGGTGGGKKQKEKVDPGTKGTGDTYQSADAFLDSLFQGFQPLDLSGAPKVLTADDLAAQRQSVYQSMYQTDTEGFDKKRADAIEAKKQELANRGIPMGTLANDPNDPYANAIADINTQYDQAEQRAKNAANIGADQSLLSYVGANTAAADAFTKNAVAQYQGQLDAMSTTGSIITDLMQKYGLDQARATALLQMKTQKEIARIQASRPTGGSGGGGMPDNSPIIGGNAPGFNV